METNDAVIADAAALIAGEINDGETRKIFPNVKLGKDVVIEDYCIIGYPPKGAEPGELETVIGDGSVIRSHTVIYAGTTIGKKCHIGHGNLVREFCQWGDNSSLGGHSIVEHHCIIGSNVRIQGQVGVCEYSIIEDDAWIGPRVMFTNVYHPTCERAKECLAGPIVRSGAKIAACVTICPDLEVGKDSFTGAGAVLTKSVEDYAIMFGNPAKKVGVTQKFQCRYDMMNGKAPYPVAAPKQKRIPLVDLAAQHQSKKEILRLAMDKVVYNTRFINGKEVGEFEAAFAEFCGVKNAIGVSNGTDALVLILKAMGIGAGDEVITSPHTFFATAEAILVAGATPVFVDIDQQTFNIDPKKIEAAITEKTKAIMPVHLYGRPADMLAISELAKQHGLKLISDAAQAHGSSIDGKLLSEWADATSFSFYPGKNLGAYGDAGGVVTNDDALATRIRKLRDHGRLDKYRHDVVGMNCRLDTIQAAVLLTKLRFLKRWNEARRGIAQKYREGLAGLPITLPEDPENAVHVYHMFVLRTDQRDALQQHLDELNVSTGIHYPIPLHLQPALETFGGKLGDFPEAEAVVGEILSLPMFPEMEDVQIQRVIDGVRSFFDGAAK